MFSWIRYVIRFDGTTLPRIEMGDDEVMHRGQSLAEIGWTCLVRLDDLIIWEYRRPPVSDHFSQWAIFVREDY